MIDVVIVYELPQRELENTLLLKAQFELDGLSCEIVNYPFVGIEKLRKKYYNNVKCVMVVSLYDESVLYNLVYSIFGKTKYVVNLQYEQVRSNVIEKDENAYCFPKGIAKDAIHLCWGEKPAELLRRRGVSDCNTPIVGPIQMDFLRKEFSDYYFNKYSIKEKYGIAESQKIILFISSFSYARLGHSNREKLIKKIGRDYVENLEKVTIETQREVLEWFEKFLDEHTDYTIIYRKHPAEMETDILLEMDSRYDNFLIISDYSVKQWIMTVDIISVWYSTSVAEAYFAEKKFNILRPINMSNEQEIVIMNDAKFTKDYQSFLDYVTQTGVEWPIQEKVLKAYYDVSEIPSFIRISSYVKSLLVNESCQFVWPEKLLEEFGVRYKKQQFTLFLTKLKNILASAMIWMKKKGVVFPKEVSKRLDSRTRTLKMLSDKEGQIELLMKNEEIIKRIVSNINKKVGNDLSSSWNEEEKLYDN